MNIDFKPYDLKEEIKASSKLLNNNKEFEVAIDIGSTETRLLEFRSKCLEFDKVLAVDSPYAVIEGDFNSTISKSETIYDNMEFVIEDISQHKSQEDKIIKEKIRIIKGGLLQDTQMTVTATNSNQGKIEQEPTYINTIVALALRAHIRNIGEPVATRDIVPRIVISLPPKDTSNQDRVENFKNMLSGMYKVELVRYNTSFNILIKAEDILVEDESNAVLRFWNTMYDVDMTEEGLNIVIDGGGSTVDFALMKSGRLLNKFSRSLPFGGNKLKEYISDDYVSKTGKIAPKENQMNTAIERGYLAFGKHRVSVKDSTHIAKARISKEILLELDKLFDSSSFGPEEVENIVCSGGMFKQCKQGLEYDTPSLERYLRQVFSSKSEYTDFSRIECDYPIPYGLAFYKASKVVK